VIFQIFIDGSVAAFVLVSLLVIASTKSSSLSACPPLQSLISLVHTQELQEATPITQSLHQPFLATATMPWAAVLPQGVGYAVTIGIGFFFALLMVGISWIFTRYSGNKASAEEFTSASRSVKPGLIAAGVVSAWSEFSFPHFAQVILCVSV
jgi:hypothetical protein